MIRNETMNIVSAKETMTALQDCCLAMENMFIAAAFFGYPGPSVKDRGERRGTVEYK